MLAFSRYFGYLLPMTPHGKSRAHLSPVTHPHILALALSLGSLVVLAGSASSASRSDVELEASILRAKPAVVLISSEVGAEVTIRCGAGPAQTVRPDPLYETGSGFIVHPDGYIATNGHVVERFYEMNEQGLAADFVKAGAAEACGPVLAMLPEGARKERLRAIAADPANRNQVRLIKKLQVHLSTGKIYAADVKAYSPAINPDAPPGGKVVSGGGKGAVEQSGKDVALLKIEANNLPTVRLAPASTGLQLGGQIFIIGYPGVVLNHDFLSRKSALEASVTVGRVSGFKIDITDRRVIQTDAAISWGNSGGPAFDLRGEVIGAATFISTTSEGDQAIQGFNFLIPVETIHEFARGISLTPTADSPFTQKWERAVTSYFQGDYTGAAQQVEEADRIMPGFPDLLRLRSEAQMRAEREPGFGGRRLKVGIGLGAGLGMALLALGVRTAVNRKLRRAQGRVQRISPDEIRNRLEAGAPVAVVDARHGGNFDESPVQVAGALRYDIERPSSQALQVQVAPSGEVVAYCD
ncbi:MAG: trypsin-like peptidase domain-containing protein [candidate division NC10 bacterium]|nr:trypsin-like peptidase domain-containing protein [candidate division NC10 bacterium]